jgi:alanine-glyoxylate transaminase/serine-glyoxylate transaminase/serine-pyruvate transaminase
VLDALSQATVGHLDPFFVDLMEETAELLRAAFGTANAATLPISATGSGGMDALVVNFVEPGDRVVVGVNGLFGERLSDELGRADADVVRIEAEWGRAIDIDRIRAAVAGADAVCVVHGETSTGVCQPMDGIAEACRDAGVLLFVDCVTSLTGQPVVLDEWGGDGGRVYHHTAPINMIYALAEALRIVAEEGLEARWERHRRAHEALRGALAPLGFERLAPDGEELWPLLAVTLPDGVDGAVLRGALLADHGIEISVGLGPLAGKVFRIGVMGEGARPEPQERLVSALAQLMKRDVKPALEALADGWATAPA